MQAGVVLWTQRSTLHALAHEIGERRAAGCWWHDAATQADARVQAGADVLAESANDAPDCCACGTASNFVRADGSGCGASGGSIQAAAARRTAAATGWESRWSRPRDRLAATKTRFARAAKAQGCAFCETGVCVLSKVPRLRFKVKRSVMRRDANKPCAVIIQSVPRGRG